ncbi:MAG: hypothetical protein PHI40_08240 [Caldisericia bacterium]|nr:hypothetical protein [Caldisericia bacterium]MDD4615373.1 hypothetical protein [Caldisericia bacterium]
MKKRGRTLFVLFFLFVFLLVCFAFLNPSRVAIHPIVAKDRPNVGCQIACDPFRKVSKDQLNTDWFSAVEHMYYHSARSCNKALRDLSLEELHTEFDLWYDHLGWKYHLENYGWAGKNGTSEYYHYDPWDQYCWEYTIREYLQPVEGYGYKRAVLCDTVRVEIATLQMIHWLINCRVREKIRNTGHNVIFFCH